jgi:hypothetical protein
MRHETPQRLRSRNLEELAFAAVAAHLRCEGRLVENPERPPAETATRSPDFLFTIDREPVALEVVRFLPPTEVGTAHARLRSIETALKDRLQADAVAAGLKVVLDVSFAVPALQAYRRPQVAADADLLATEVRHLLNANRGSTQIGLALSSVLPWLISGEVSIWPVPHPSVLIGSWRTAQDLPDAAAFVERTIGRKGDQHRAFVDRAILAVAGGSHDQEALADAFRECSLPIPWWRIYFVHTGGDTALLYDSDAGTGSH